MRLNKGKLKIRDFKDVKILALEFFIFNRFAQVSETQTGYFLGDALGSVRQVADDTGSVNLVQSYSPYGEVIASVGSYETAFSYTGEMTDGTGLVYLRARYYDPGTGRFVNKDTWGGDYNNPLSMNKWNYVGGNPINRFDPSGQCWIMSENGSAIWYPENYPICQTNEARSDSDLLSSNPSSISMDPSLCSFSNIASCLQTNQNYSIITPSKKVPIWQIIQYGKDAKFTSYSSTPEFNPINSNVDQTIPIFGIPFVFGAGGGNAMRTENGSIRDEVNTYFHVGVGVAIIKSIELHGGLLFGSNTGLYIEAAIGDNDCGIQLAYPDTAVYSPFGEIGISTKVNTTRWFLTNDQYIQTLGGYEAFGDRFVEEGFTNYSIVMQNTNLDNLLFRWSNNLGKMYVLEVRQ